MGGERNGVVLLFTCEHGGNRIPAQYRALFRDCREVLESHRGYDPGALALARDFASTFKAALVSSTTSRLLVELNRSPHHPAFFSKVTRKLSREEKEKTKNIYYDPYRRTVEAHIADALAGGRRVLHLSCHSFTPRLEGITRNADIGLLYDPRRSGETAFCLAWQRALQAGSPDLRIRRNYPYRGTLDGLTTHLRQIHPHHRYSGLEIEVNQKHTTGEPSAWRKLRKLITSTFRKALDESGRD